MGAYVRSDLHLLVHLCDAVVVPSLFESKGLCKLEIESLNVKVISSKTGGMDGTLEPGNIDMLVKEIEDNT
jgi:glycosyltransferase involved in cell wall biosynthesis